ncbi:transcriptional regulator [Pseudomonas gingeri NCPPB 3146 = LMG 5327]|uniref:LysR family transcriptional regulator n=2 Tax=Pseudomonas gingeri TaxID=117681 RepID=A0A7Y7XWH1_9PSED|nr:MULTISPECIES: LysR family transcriptional regulator [Pseudomonas]NVZ24319.1 LysR family transcriptional regulator [Pseudomonas gingeri]NVZ66031.1 LysR family transcriptional regulator [Pseudomonas gingeri]NVZ75991.1 LysR family transcriptional regulator [Pseudomonas gingeri]NWC13605.1 LysR family transcriptional regulator [Pseudomonas gingeri]NWE47302.1 LysR family transcriptional regulator [Pseudomonas gingeri]
MSRINVRNISRTDLNLLLTFHCLMTERSATRASAVLHVTQGAVSSALRRLREQFGDELFVRTSSGMQPTRRALEIAPMIAEALSTVSALLGADAAFSPQESHYVFNLAMSDDLEAFLAPRLVEAVSRERLGIRFAFHQTNSSLWKNALHDPAMDLVICSEPKDFSTNYSSQVLFSSSYSCLYRPGAGEAEPLSLEDYFAAEHVRICFDGRRGFIDDLFEKAGHTRKVTASFTHFAGALTTLLSSDVVATIPTFAARTFSQHMALTLCPVPLAVPSFRCFMVWDIAKQEKPQHEWIRRFISQITQGLE